MITALWILSSSHKSRERNASCADRVGVGWPTHFGEMVRIEV